MLIKVNPGTLRMDFYTSHGLKHQTCMKIESVNMASNHGDFSILGLMRYCISLYLQELCRNVKSDKETRKQDRKSEIQTHEIEKSIYTAVTNSVLGEKVIS